jgi:hypothetical protein
VERFLREGKVSNNFEGPKREDRFMAPFRVDISKVRISVCKLAGHTWSATATMSGRGSYTTTGADPGLTARNAAVALDVYHYPTLQPHPWKRADGSHIKAGWEDE